MNLLRGTGPLKIGVPEHIIVAGWQMKIVGTFGDAETHASKELRTDCDQFQSQVQLRIWTLLFGAMQLMIIKLTYSACRTWEQIRHVRVKVPWFDLVQARHSLLRVYYMACG